MANTGSFLTDQQKRVLELRLQGFTQDKVAQLLSTSRANVSIIEKRAHQNIQKARNTLKEWEHIQFPVSISIEPGTDIMDVPRLIFHEADRLRIKVYENTLDIIARLHEAIPESIQHRRTVRPLRVHIRKNGEVSFERL